jgi:outer membrane lipoprotein-sorting protein
MKKTTYFLIISGLFLSLPIAASDELNGRDIAIKADQADSSLDSQRNATMLIQRGSQKLIRKMKMWDKKFTQKETRSLIRFDEPADVSNTQYLSWVYDETNREDDLWIYFPTENLVRRISGGGKKGAFMRSDFSNEDIEQRAVDDDEHLLLKSEIINDRDHFVIESTPVQEKSRSTNYSKRIIWIDKEYWLPIKIEYYNNRRQLLKTLTQGGIESIDGIWTSTKLVMETPKKKTRTLMQYFDVAYNVGLEDSLFNQSALKR